MIKLKNLLTESFDIHSTTGKRISFSGWEWRPLMHLIENANKKYNLGISDKDIRYWHSNNDQGLSTQEECNKLAAALTDLIKEKSPNSIIRLDPNLVPDEYKSDKTIYTKYGVSMDRVLKFIEFLRTCNGFKIN